MYLFPLSCAKGLSSDEFWIIRVGKDEKAHLGSWRKRNRCTRQRLRKKGYSFLFSYYSCLQAITLSWDGETRFAFLFSLPAIAKWMKTEVMGPALTFPVVSVIYLPCRRGRIHCISSLGNPDHWERKGLITGLERWPLPSILKAQKQNTLSFLLSISLGTAEFSGPSISRSLTRCSVLFAFTSLLAIWMPYNYICKHVFLIILHVMYFFVICYVLNMYLQYLLRRKVVHNEALEVVLLNEATRNVSTTLNQITPIITRLH